MTKNGRWLALAALGLAQLMIVLDTTVMTIALPSAQRELGLSDSGRQWTLTAYTVVFGGLLLLGGRLADRFGRRRTLLAGIAGFALASALGGAAPSASVLIAARALQGVFAALLSPSTISLLSLAFPDSRERGRAYGVFSAIMMSGGATGMIAGGALTQYAGWRWCLYLSVPLAAFALAGAVRFVPDAPANPAARLDWASALLGCFGVGSLVYALSSARPWLAIAGAALLLTFVVRQTRAANPLLPLGILTDRRRAAAFGTVAAAAFATIGTFLFLTYQLQSVCHYGALAAALAFLPTLAANVLSATRLSPPLLARFGPRPLLTGGLVVLACGLFVTTSLTPDAPYAVVVLPALVLLGAGSGLAMPTVLNVATHGVEPHNTGAASAFVTTSQQVGASIGIAALTSIAAAATPDASPAATVQGYAVAGFWGGIVLTVVAGAVWWCARTQMPAHG